MVNASQPMFRSSLVVIGLTLSAVAAYYSITGLAFVFAGAYWPIVCMGASLEAAKVMASSWLFRSWRTAPKILVAYLGIGVLALMLLTGIGIFGYLSRAYMVQQAPLTQMAVERDNLERTVALAQTQYDRAAETLQRTNTQTTDRVIERLSEVQRFSGQNGAVSVLRSQQEAQRALQAQVDLAAQKLADAEQARANFVAQAQIHTVDLGPLMFAASAWYGSTDVPALDKTVRVFIALIMFVFDPMALALILAGQWKPTEPTVDIPLPLPQIRSTPPVLPIPSDTPNLSNVAPPLPTLQNTAPMTHHTYVPFVQMERDPTQAEPSVVMTTTEPADEPVYIAPGLDTDTDTFETLDGTTTLPVKRPTRARRSRVAPKQ